MLQASLVPARSGAQWSGITTRIAERLLETGAADAVLAMAPDPNDHWRPMPVRVTSAEGMAQCRSMRMGYAPLLALLEPARARGFKRLAVIGIPCQVYALRELEREYGFERHYVIGTPCSDNTTTENFHQFFGLVATQLKRRAQDITDLEFRADYRIELRFKGACQSACRCSGHRTGVRPAARPRDRAMDVGEQGTRAAHRRCCPGAVTSAPCPTRYRGAVARRAAGVRP